MEFVPGDPRTRWSAVLFFEGLSQFFGLVAPIVRILCRLLEGLRAFLTGFNQGCLETRLAAGTTGRL